MKEPKIISETLKYEGKIFNVVQRELEQEDGTIITRDVVIKQKTVSAIIMNEKGEVYLQQEYRSGINQVTWGFPSGIVEDWEQPSTAVKREVLEETGYKLFEEPHEIGNGGALSEGFTNEIQHIFMCNVNTKNGRTSQNLDDGEHITNGRWVAPQDIANSILNTSDNKTPYLSSMSGQYLLSTYCFALLLGGSVMRDNNII